MSYDNTGRNSNRMRGAMIVQEEAVIQNERSYDNTRGSSDTGWDELHEQLIGQPEVIS